MDTIELQGIACQALLGVTRKERKQRQFVRVDASIGLDLEPAANTDDLELTVDYHQLVKRIQKTVHDHECYLLESLTSHLCRSLLAHGRIRHVRLRVYKFPADLTDDVEHVAVEMSRGRE